MTEPIPCTLYGSAMFNFVISLVFGAWMARDMDVCMRLMMAETACYFFRMCHAYNQTLGSAAGTVVGSSRKVRSRLLRTWALWDKCG